MSKRSGVNIQINHTHSRAICDEIAYRLRQILRRESAELPPYLQQLVERLAESEGDVAPSIVPSLEDMMVRREQITLYHEDAPAYADLAD
jgi:hypothetical protein